jgi:hypothetical protein
MIVFFSSFKLPAQKIITQNILGTVIDKSTGAPLFGATVAIIGSDPLIGAVTDEKGKFMIRDIPVGRIGIRADYLGYHTRTMTGLNLVSGKELIVNIEMEQKVIEGEEVVIRVEVRKDQPLNEMAMVSARSFTVEETEKYAGSLGDPARMAMSFAGVMGGADQVNDIIIRGNSPLGLLWRLEGINIPNPNHFGAIGSTGGPISMLNNNVLSNSDFYTGAFPAEFGNALSGVFDLRLRSGNNQNREYTAQVGLNGFEFGCEGPILRNRQDASYIAHYRYSTLAILHLAGLNIGVRAIPFYQDLSFKIDLPGRSAGKWSLFGLGGENHIALEENDNDKKELTRIATSTGVLGFTHTYFFNPTLRLKSSMALIIARDHETDSLNRNGLLEDFYWDRCLEGKYVFTSEIRKKFSPANLLFAGINFDMIGLDYRDSIFSTEINDYYHSLEIRNSLMLIQSYVQWKHSFTDNCSFIAGLHHQQITLNHQLVIEPRASIRWNLNARQSLSVGYGLHSQMQQRAIYFEKTLIDTVNMTYEQTNRELDFSRSHHFVMSFKHLFNPDLRLKAEAYYQYLFDIPVKQNPSFVSMINYGSSFIYGDYDSLVNEGTGRNLGLELTFEHFFSSNYYWLATLSLFDSKYKASDGKIRNTAYNGNFIFNLLAGYEWNMRGQNTLSADLKAVWAGGLRSIPVDLEASREQARAIYDYSSVYKKRYDNYYRIDVRISFRMNRPKTGHLIALDIQNVTNRKNRFLEEYNPDNGSVEQVYQIGILPIVLWRIYF